MHEFIAAHMFGERNANISHLHDWRALGFMLQCFIIPYGNAIPWGSTYTHRGYTTCPCNENGMHIYTKSRRTKYRYYQNAKVITHRTYVMHIWFTIHDVHI